MAKAKEKFDLGAWEKEVNGILDDLKKNNDPQNIEIQTKIKDLFSTFKNATNVNQRISNSPLCNSNIVGGTFNINVGGAGGTPNKSIDIKSFIIELIELLQAIIKGKKTDVTISDNDIRRIIDEITQGVTDNVRDLINKRYEDLCKEFESKINGIIDAIGKIKTGDNEEIISKLKKILERSRKIFKDLGDKILEQLKTMKDLLDEISKNLTAGMDKIGSEIQDLRKELDNLNSELNTKYNRIENTLEEHGKKLDIIIKALADINKNIDEIKDLLNNLKPESMSDLLKLINELTSKVNEANNNIQGISDLIAVRIIPTIDGISRSVGELATKFPELSRSVNDILLKVDDLGKNMKSLVTRAEFNERLDRLEELIRNIIAALNKRPHPSRPIDEIIGKKFELRWILVKNEKIAKKIKKDEKFPDSKEYILLNQYQITVDLDQSKREILPREFIGKIGLEISSKGFDLEKAFICLGARVVGSEKPWRWDIKHLKTSSPDLYSKLVASGGSGEEKRVEHDLVKIREEIESILSKELKGSDADIKWHTKNSFNRIKDVKKSFDDIKKTKLYVEMINQPKIKYNFDAVEKSIDMMMKLWDGKYSREGANKVNEAIRSSPDIGIKEWAKQIIYFEKILEDVIKKRNL